jgi:hypothetical protein
VNRKILGILLPLVFQLLFALAIILATKGTGSFVGLGAMLLGLVALPVTAVVNWTQIRSQPDRPAPQLAARIFLITAIFPACLIVLYALAS